MYNETMLRDGSEIQITHSAMVLEKLIGQFLYNIGNNSNPKLTNTTSEPAAESSTPPNRHK